MRAFVLASFLFVGIQSLHAEAIPKPAATPVEGNINWVYDYAEGQKLSKKTGKPMFVVFRCER